MGRNKRKGLLEILVSTPEGVPVSVLRKKLGYTVNKGVTNMVYLLKKDGYQIAREKDLFILKSSAKKSVKSMSSTTLTDMILELLSKNRNGATSKQLAEETGTDPNKIYSALQCLKQRGLNVQRVKNKYYINGKNDPIKTDNTYCTEKIVNTTHVSNCFVPAQGSSINDALINQKKTVVPNEYLPAFKKLSDTDKIDFIDMIRKSVYYKKSAISLLEATVETEEILHMLERDL